MMWMPLHKSKGPVGKLRLSNGVCFTEFDRQANDMPDGLAKAAVEIHRVKAEEVRQWEGAFAETTGSQSGWPGPHMKRTTRSSSFSRTRRRLKGKRRGCGGQEESQKSEVHEAEDHRQG